MPVETTADLAAFFDTNEFAEAATYTPVATGIGQPVTVIPNRPRDQAAFGALDIVAPARSCMIRQAEVATPKRGDTLLVGGETLTVEKVTLDRLGSLYLLDLSL